jgi:hypothetical protein
MVRGQQRWATYLRSQRQTLTVDDVYDGDKERISHFCRELHHPAVGERASAVNSNHSVITNIIGKNRRRVVGRPDDNYYTGRISADNDLQHNNRTPARRPSADMVGRYLKTIRQEAELETQAAQASAPSTSRRQQFREWAESRSNADPLTPPVSGSSEETIHLPVHRLLAPPPSPTSTNDHVASACSTSTTDIPPNVVLQQLYQYLANRAHYRVARNRRASLFGGARSDNTRMAQGLTPGAATTYVPATIRDDKM